eukprot:TRINITY_DN56840_c0_g1_i1.p1 TRINITY_DN56840_c0_g1~~TRINITY_DN56840_c0_g1_i1.p1  ORF type:complete len:105 (+),score=32.55 TRINITY_DN56840_c0_g1_i1:34-348(+)
MVDEAALNSSNASDVSGEPEHYDLLTKWWFYILLFLGVYAFVVAVHLYFDYKQWESERARLLEEEAEARTSSRPAGTPADKAKSSTSSSSTVPVAQQAEDKKVQ